MKRTILILLSIAMVLSATACGGNTTSSESTSTENVQAVEPIQLVNKMTETELSRVDKHELTLLDVPEEPTTEAEPAQTEHKVSVEFHTPSIDEWRENIESYRDHMTDEEYETAMENIRIAEEKGENGGSPYASIILVDGYLVPYAVPYADPNYDGGLISFTTSTMDENGEPKTEELSFESFEEYLDWIRKMDAEYGYSDEMIEQDVQETPIVYFDPNDTSKIKGLYFDKNSSNSITKELTRKAYEDIQTKAKSLQWYTTKSASTVSKEEALQALVYDGQPLNGKFENSVENLKGNDENGTLNVRYKTTYENWWDTSKSSSFYVETTITGMYAMNGSSFNFVTVNNGNTENDEKLKEQNKFKESAYPSSVKWEDIEKYFIIANIKDISQNVIKLDESMITLKPDDEKGILEVTVDYTKKLPSGLPSNYLTYKNEFSGFLNLQGYNYHILTDEEQNKSNEIKEIKQNSFPSELSVQQYLDNFITLGQSYSRNVNDWDFNVVADDYKGSLIINLTYNPKATPLPANFPENYKKIVKDVTVNGFKNITEQFKTIKVKNYVGIKNADDIWNEYEKILNDGQNNFISTSLASLISVPYVDNFADLTIERNNSENPNVLDLTVSVKVGTTTRLLVNRQNFTFDSTTESKFKENKLDYPYKVQINVETIEQAFLWKKPDGQTVNYTNNKAETIKINLNDYQYKTINSNMYADEVTEQDIKNLFEAIGFINIKISLQTDNQDGIVYATVSLNSTDNFDVEQNANKSIVQLQSTSNDNSNSSNINTNTIPDGSVFVKRFEISGFKKPVSPVVITITSSVIAVIVLFSIIFLVYLKVIRKNLHKVIINKEDKKFVKKIELKNQIKKNRMIKRNRKKLIKRINH